MLQTLDQKTIYFDHHCFPRITEKLKRSEPLQKLAAQYYEGELRQAFKEFLPRLVRNAMWSHRLASGNGDVFLAWVGRQSFRLVTISEGEAIHVLRAVVLNEDSDSPEHIIIGQPANIKPGLSARTVHEMKIKQIHEGLVRRGWKVYGDVPQFKMENGKEVWAGANQPDIQARKGDQRLIIEIDSHPDQSTLHQKQITKADPTTRAIYLVINKNGRTVASSAYNPPPNAKKAKSGYWKRTRHPLGYTRVVKNPAHGKSDQQLLRSAQSRQRGLRKSK